MRHPNGSTCPLSCHFSFWSATMIQMWQEIKEEKQEYSKYWEAKTTQLC